MRYFLVPCSLLMGVAFPGLTYAQAPASPAIGQETASQSAAPAAKTPGTPQQSAAGQAAGKTSSAPSGPIDPKAKRSYEEASKLMKESKYAFALDGFRKADKQDGGGCLECEVAAYKAALKSQDFKAAREETSLLLEHVTSAAERAKVHVLAGQACMSEGMNDKRDKSFEQADNEFKTALGLQPDMAECYYDDGMALAHLKQDALARERFQQFLKLARPTDLDYERAQRFSEHPEVARGRLAPNFRLVDMDGKTFTLESFAGKVVLIDFWATWCGPCREALPHIRQIAQKFQGQPFVAISISLDRDDAKWKDFVAHNGMTWIQYRDGYFDGAVAKTFGVNVIPATFTIDSDGVLQDQHVGDADIEGKIKKLVARAQEAANRKTVAEVR